MKPSCVIDRKNRTDDLGGQSFGIAAKLIHYRFERLSARQAFEHVVLKGAKTLHRRFRATVTVEFEHSFVHQDRFDLFVRRASLKLLPIFMPLPSLIRGRGASVRRKKISTRRLVAGEPFRIRVEAFRCSTRATFAHGLIKKNSVNSASSWPLIRRRSSNGSRGRAAAKSATRPDIWSTGRRDGGELTGQFTEDMLIIPIFYIFFM